MTGNRDVVAGSATARVAAVKLNTLSKSAFAVTALLVATACAGGSEVTATEAPADTTKKSTEPTLPSPSDTSTPATSAPEKKCVSTCATDADCGNSCPSVPNGVQCCDTQTKTCWTSKTSTCPSPTNTSDDPPPAY